MSRGVRPLVRLRQSQPAVADRRVQGQKVSVAEDIRVEQQGDAGGLERWQRGLDIRKHSVRHIPGQVVLKQRQAGGQHCMDTYRNAEVVGKGLVGAVVVNSQAAIGGDAFRVINDLTGDRPVPIKVYGVQK